MNAFIKKHEYNYIRKRLYDLDNAFKVCLDPNIIEVTKAYKNQQILNIFTDLTGEQKELLDISKLTTPLHIDKFLDELSEYVYGMTNITNAQIGRLFKKEKKLKFPNSDAQETKNVYLGWIDNSTNKLFVTYNMDGKLLGMACRVSNSGTNNAHRCVLCNHSAGDNEVNFVSPICKTTGIDSYRSIGFDLCLDSKKCNERVVSTEKLVKLLKDVNNIK